MTFSYLALLLYKADYFLEKDIIRIPRPNGDGASSFVQTIFIRLCLIKEEETFVLCASFGFQERDGVWVLSVGLPQYFPSSNSDYSWQSIGKLRFGHYLFCIPV